MRPFSHALSLLLLFLIIPAEASCRDLIVTRMDDDIKHPPQGCLRWALQEKGPRTVRLQVSGDIILKDQIVVREPGLTLDGSDSPATSIRGGSIVLSDTHDIVLRHLRIRLGTEPAARQREKYKLPRPRNSSGLDCVSLSQSRNILIEYCSFSESCDELINVERCRDVLIRHCLFRDPLAGPELHPYGDRHAFALNASSSTLRIEQCLMARYVMRGPQFECNDMRPEDEYTVHMESVSNLLFDYARSGSRYSLGVEKGSGTGEGKQFEFVFRDNFFLTNHPERPAIEAITKHGRDAKVELITENNQVITPSPTSKSTQEASWILPDAALQILEAVGCQPLDESDQEIIETVKQGRFKF